MTCSTAGSSADERAQRAVAERVARGTGREHLAGQRDLQQLLVGTGDADGDRLGLVLDRVDRPGELLDAGGERGGEVLDDPARRADRAVLDLVHVEREQAGGVAQQRRDAHRGAGLEVTVVAADAQTVEERGRGPSIDGAEAYQQIVARRRSSAELDTTAATAARTSRSGRADASMASAAS